MTVAKKIMVKVLFCEDTLKSKWAVSYFLNG